MSQHPLRTTLVAVLAAVVLVGWAGPAVAAPPAPGNPSDGEITAAQAAQDAAAAEVGRIAGLAAAAQAQLEQAQVQAESAGIAYEAAQEAVAIAQAAADQTAAALAAATAQVDASQGRLSVFSRDSYMDGATLTTTAALLDAAGPGELIQRAALLEWVADNQVDVLGEFEAAQVVQANADSAARQALDQQAAAEQVAADAKATADSQVAAQQSVFATVSAEKAGYDAQLQAAQVQLLSLQGARNAYQAWLDQKAAEEAAAVRAQQAAAAAAAAAAATARSAPPSSSSAQAGYVLPAAGRTSSCYGARWGTSHNGVDIAAPIGTPVYAATAGTVQRAGAATGFGQAVYILGTDGAVTVYGHVSRYYVSAGERVQAGEQIADVGNEGQSTGPHLHFEVHPGGAMHSGAVDPVPWLSARGVSIRGC